MLQQIAGRTALVTGASSGIGRAIATRLARAGVHVIAVARREERLQELVRHLSGLERGSVQMHVADLSDPQARLAVVQRCDELGHGIDILVNSAGFGSFGDFREVPWSRYDEMIRVNIAALTDLCWRFASRMQERRWGRILNVASLAAYLPCPMVCVYAATKAYVRNFTEALDHELRHTGVRATAVCPGVVRTEFSRVAGHRVRRLGLVGSLSADQCASIALASMLAGRRLAVPGWLPMATSIATSLIPRRWVPAVADAVMRAAARPWTVE